ncbi:MAG: crosslink repair DNA glycosylase YcaQ family protein [Candidatus Lokiarchaeota archaeon]
MDFDELSEQDAIVIVIKNYINSYGPVTENDIIWWLGLPKTKIIKILKILEDQLTTIKIGDFKLDYLISNTQLELLNNLEENEKSIINLLPLLDPYLMSYKDRRRYVSSKDYNYIYDRSGNATTVILLDGRVIGIWDYQEQPLAKIMIHLFYKVSENVFEEIEKLGSSIGKFITGQSVNIKYEDEMIPLTKRKAGRFMHPLL